MRRRPLAAQLSIPEIPYDAVDPIKLPDDIYLGEAVGVATNSKGNIFVYTRTGNPNATLGTRRTFARGAARLFEFDPSGKYIREIGQGLYGFLFAHTVRVDRQDNIWVVDEGANMVIKFDPEGRVVMTMGRKPEAISVPGGAGGGGEEGGGGGRGRGAGAAPGAPAAPPAPVGTGVPGDNFNRPTDVAWDAQGNIYVADGYGNSRIAKFDRNGKYIKSWGSRGSAPGQFNIPHTMAIDAQGLVYVGDRQNNRVQVFDGEGTLQDAVRQRRRAVSHLHHPGAASVPLCVQLEPVDVDGQRRDLQDDARRKDRRQVRDGGEADQGVRLGARDGLQERERDLRR